MGAMSVRLNRFESDFWRYYSRQQRREVRWHLRRRHWVRYARTLGLIECMNPKCQRRPRPWQWQT